MKRTRSKKSRDTVPLTRLVAEASEGGAPYRLAQPRAAARPCKSSVISGKMQAGGIAYIYVWLERSYDPQEGHSGQHSLFVSYRGLSPQFQFSLSAVTLGIYLGVPSFPELRPQAGELGLISNKILRVLSRKCHVIFFYNMNHLPPSGTVTFFKQTFFKRDKVYM